MTRAAVDIGGTFTDLVYLSDDGSVQVGKSSTTPGQFEQGVLNVLGDNGLSDIDSLAHGSTVVINALTERKGAVTALITTRGFRDVLEIGRANRPDIYNLAYTKPIPFVPRRLRFEVTERLDHKGQVVCPLDEDEVRAAVEEALRQQAQALAICFLHAYANPVHEQLAAELVRSLCPALAVTASHEVSNEWREYERTSTTCLDAYVKPVARTYLRALSDGLVDQGFVSGIRYSMRSNGGVSRFERAAETPINMVESGPVGGVIGAAAIGRMLGEDNLITLDIGGTTAKSSLVEGGEVRLADDYHIERSPLSAGYPITVPVVDIIEIGAGGGSIAWLDDAGALHVGPRSAGADPGPVAYGRGGTQPTVTDANLIAGRINPDYFLGGRISLDVEGARAAFAPIAEALGVTVDEAAIGVIRVANASMIHLLKLVSVRRGRDPRDFAIVAFGGGGSMHASALAREMRVPRVIIPPAAGYFSAWGMLMSDLRHDLVQTRLTRLDEASPEQLEAEWAALEARLRETFAEERLPTTGLRCDRTADMRYAGQEHTVTAPVPDGPLDEERIAEVRRVFHELHEQLYTFRQESPVELVNFRVTGYGAVDRPEPPRLADGGSVEDALKEAREVDFDQVGRLAVRVYERALLGAGARFEGPAVIEEEASSTVVFPDQLVRVDELGNLVIETGCEGWA